MASTFPHTGRSLKTDTSRTSVWVLGLVTLLLTAWAAWFFLAEVGRYEVTENARLEVAATGHPIESPVIGRVVSSTLVMGKRIQTGEILVVLDSEPQRLQLREERTRLQSLPPRVKALRNQIAAEEAAGHEELGVTQAAVGAARARREEAEAAARLASEEAERMRRLFQNGLVAEAEYRRSRADVEQARAVVESLGKSLARLDLEQRVRERTRDARILELQVRIAELTGLISSASARVGSLEHEMERRFIRAPVDGVLGEVAVLRPGAFLDEGDGLGVVVPDGEVRVVAEFAPPAALGRIVPGQPARVRLDGFPWLQYGSLPATVAMVGSEIRDGRVRVELVLEDTSESAVPLQHGLPGTVEVRTEEMSPAKLVLRAAGKRIATPRSWFEGSATP
jgi:membrane fusion protein (multidrug efflux system)